MNIIIVDDDKLVSLSLKTILEASGEVNVCAIGNCGEEALSLYPKFKPDILLMDIRMDGMSGLTAGKQILETYPDAKILFLTTFSDDEYIVRALRMGAKGYLLKQNFESILPALQAVQKGPVSYTHLTLPVELPINQNSFSLMSQRWQLTRRAETKF